MVFPVVQMSLQREFESHHDPRAGSSLRVHVEWRAVRRGSLSHEHISSCFLWGLLYIVVLTSLQPQPCLSMYCSLCYNTTDIDQWADTICLTSGFYICVYAGLFFIGDVWSGYIYRTCPKGLAGN